MGVPQSPLQPPLQSPLPSQQVRIQWQDQEVPLAVRERALKLEEEGVSKNLVIGRISVQLERK